jgi:hypothetical protein
MGILKDKFRKCFQKPWSGIYSTEIFSKMVLDKWSWTWRKKELVGFQKALVITKCSLRTINPCNHITPVLDGA